MSRYPSVPLEEKFAWMRERQREKDDEARQRLEKDVRAKLTREEAERLLNEPEPEQRWTPPRRKMLRVDQVAEILGVSVATVQRWFRDCALIVHPGPRKTTMLISEQVLDDWIVEHTAKPRRRR